MDEWYYAQGREKRGPIPRAQLVDFIQSGVVTPGTPVWTREMAEWLPAAQVPGLLNTSAPAPVPAPVPQAPTAEPQAQQAPVQEPSQSESGNPWDSEIDAQSQQQPHSADNLAESGSDASKPRSNPPTAALKFNSKRPKLDHQKAGSRMKNFIAKVAAVVIALGILGGGGYLGAQYLGIFEPNLEPRVRYLPDDPDFFFTLNVPKLMSVAQSIDPSGRMMPTDIQAGNLPIGPESIQDLTVAGNFAEKRWVVVATLAKELDVTKLFPGGGEPDSIRAGGTKIYYDRDMSGVGVDFAIAQPSKTTLVIGPLATLKTVFKRRSAPQLPDAFKPLLESSNSAYWIAGAVDIKSLWRLADDFPIELDDRQRWLLESLDKATFTLGGSGEYEFRLVAHCNQVKDAELIAKEAREAVAKQRTIMLEQLVDLGQPVNKDTLELINSLKIEADDTGAVTISQYVTGKMLEELRKLSIATNGGLTAP